MKCAGVAITAPVPGALLTGLVAALGPACRLRRRYAHAPAGAISGRRCAASCARPIGPAARTIWLVWSICCWWIGQASRLDRPTSI